MWPGTQAMQGWAEYKWSYKIDQMIFIQSIRWFVLALGCLRSVSTALGDATKVLLGLFLFLAPSPLNFRSWDTKFVVNVSLANHCSHIKESTKSVPKEQVIEITGNHRIIQYWELEGIHKSHRSPTPGHALDHRSNEFILFLPSLFYSLLLSLLSIFFPFLRVFLPIML